MRRIVGQKVALVVSALVFAAITLAAPATAFASGVDMYRLYNRWTGEHFYTASASERDGLEAVGWRYEGVGWVAPSSGDEVFRLYNPYVGGGDHHYTASEAERDSLVAQGWRYEGVGWLSGGGVEVLRQYNPYASTGTHNYTTSLAENDSLVSAGWMAEGVGWFAVGEGRLLPPEQPSDPQQPGGSQQQPGDPQPSVVYWTSGGEVWHSTKDCPSLKRSKNIHSGSIEQARTAGKDRPCKNCC